MARALRTVGELRQRWRSYVLSTRWRYVQELKSHWKEYSLQSLLCVLVLFIAFMVLRFEHAVIIASIGATAFIVFSMPDSVTAKPRNVVGGHLVGLALGTVSTLVPQPDLIYSAIVYSVAVGATMFIMVVSDTEHPPAAGTALGIAISGYSLNAAIAVITGAVLMSVAHHFLKPYLKYLP